MGLVQAGPGWWVRKNCMFWRLLWLTGGFWPWATVRGDYWWPGLPPEHTSSPRSAPDRSSFSEKSQITMHFLVLFYTLSSRLGPCRRENTAPLNQVCPLHIFTSLQSINLNTYIYAIQAFVIRLNWHALNWFKNINASTLFLLQLLSNVKRYPN